MAGWFASSGAPYAAEVCERTLADVKGGHLAVRNSDGRIILRDTAQTPSDQMHYSLISTVTLTSTPTTCGLTWWLCVKCYVNATAYWAAAD